jgi:hypothetical protein
MTPHSLRLIRVDRDVRYDRRRSDPDRVDSIFEYETARKSPAKHPRKGCFRTCIDITCRVEWFPHGLLLSPRLFVVLCYDQVEDFLPSRHDVLWLTHATK